MGVTIQDIEIGDNGEVAKNKINQNDANLNEAVIPAGGTVGQILQKLSSDDYDQAWIDFILTAQNWYDHNPQATPPAYNIGRIFYDETENTHTAYNDIEGISLQIGEELRARLVNDLGFEALNGAAVSVIGAIGASLQIELLDSSKLDSSIRAFGLLTHDIIDGQPGYAVRFGAVRSLNTLSFSAGDIIYGDPTTLGGWTNERPKAPNYPVRIGVCLVSDPVEGVIGVDVLAFNGSDTTVNIEGTLNGVVVETPKCDFYESGGSIYIEVTNENNPLQNLSFVLNSERYDLNTTTGGGPNGGAFAVLVAGADADTLFENFIYIWLNGGTPELKVATLSTSDELAPIGKAAIFDVTRTLAEGVYKFRRSNDAPDNGVDDGFNRWMADAIRDKLGTTYTSGIDATVVVNSTPSVTIATTAGRAMQAHVGGFTLQDGTSYSIYNDATNVATYENVSDLATIVQTALGQSLAVNGAYYRLPVYGVQNSSSGGALAAIDKLLVTRPLGFYGAAADALTDASNYDVAPNDIITEGVLFKLYTLVIGRTSGGGSTWTEIATIDNRTRLISGGGGGGASGGGGLDDKIRITANDTVNSYLDDKLVVGDMLTKTILNPAVNEQIEINLGNNVAAGGAIITPSATPNFDFDNGNAQQITLEENITSWTISNQLAAGSYVLYFVQDVTGGWTISDPTGINHLDLSLGWATTANDINIVNLVVMPDGTTIMDLVKTITV